MSDTTYSSSGAGYDMYSDYAKQQQYQQVFDFGYQQPAEVLAPHPDLFESELDSSLAGFDLNLELLTVDTHNAYQFLRSDTPTCGPPSTITVSSESAYDSLSSRSESYYDYSPHTASSAYSYPHELDMEFQRITVDPYAQAQAQAQAQAAQAALSALDAVDPSTFTSLPPTPPRSPPSRQVSGKPYVARTSYSDYGPPTRSNEYYNQLNSYGALAGAGSAVSPGHVNSQLPLVPSIPLIASAEEYKGDPRKKYKCNVCPRAFARAYNLKTHMATHDPNRLKPHVCPHRACGRSFSRKHDLGRHLISIHRDESVCSSTHSASSKHSIGVDKAVRSWCDTCGKGLVGRNASCECSDEVR